MMTYCETKMITTCSPMMRQFFDTVIVASSDEVLETVLSLLKEKVLKAE